MPKQPPPPPSVFEIIGGEKLFNLSYCRELLPDPNWESAVLGLPQRFIQNHLTNSEWHGYLTMSDYVKAFLRLIELDEQQVSAPLQQREPIRTYLILDERTGYYKIGRSRNIALREKVLHAESPNWRLVLIIDKNVENTLHRQFKHKRLRGEWFKLSSEDVEQIKSEYRSIVIS